MIALQHMLKKLNINNGINILSVQKRLALYSIGSAPAQPGSHLLSQI